MQASEHLEKWQRPSSYAGFSPTTDYLILSRHRDSPLIDRVNWDVAGEQLGAEPMDHGSSQDIPDDRPNVYHWRAGHCLVGWVEYMMVRGDAPQDTLDKAGEIVCSLADYPVLDEDRFSDTEYSAVCDYWERCSVRERVDYLSEAGLNIFAARRGELPPDDCGHLYERLREGL